MLAEWQIQQKHFAMSPSLFFARHFEAHEMSVVPAIKKEAAVGGNVRLHARRLSMSVEPQVPSNNYNSHRGLVAMEHHRNIATSSSASSSSQHFLQTVPFFAPSDLKLRQNASSSSTSLSLSSSATTTMSTNIFHSQWYALILTRAIFEYGHLIFHPCDMNPYMDNPEISIAIPEAQARLCREQHQDLHQQPHHHHHHHHVKTISAMVSSEETLENTNRVLDRAKNETNKSSHIMNEAIQPQHPHHRQNQVISSGHHLISESPSRTTVSSSVNSTPSMNPKLNLHRVSSKHLHACMHTLKNAPQREVDGTMSPAIAASTVVDCFLKWKELCGELVRAKVQQGPMVDMAIEHTPQEVGRNNFMMKGMT
jgi:hypothetical protein